LKQPQQPAFYRSSHDHANAQNAQPHPQYSNEKNKTDKRNKFPPQVYETNQSTEQVQKQPAHSVGKNQLHFSTTLNTRYYPQ